MYDPARPARERIIDIEVKRLELREALERAQRHPSRAATRGAARRERSDGEGGER